MFVGLFSFTIHTKLTRIQVDPSQIAKVPESKRTELMLKVKAGEMTVKEMEQQLLDLGMQL